MLWLWDLAEVGKCAAEAVALAWEAHCQTRVAVCLQEREKDGVKIT